MWADLLLLIVMAVCVVTDLRSRKIYNVVIFPSLVFAIGVHALTEGWAGLGFSLLGFSVGLGILLIPYLLGGMGAGDVKLLALVGALEGTRFVLGASLYMALFGAAIALGIVLLKKGIRERLQFLVYTLVCLQFRMLPNREGGYWKSGAYPYGVAIAGGAVICLGLKGWGAG